MNGVIYMYTSPSGKQYIGQTRHEIRRKLAHARAKSKSVFHQAVKKYGIDSFQYEVIHSSVTSQAALDALESIEIKSRETLVPNGYNLRHGGACGLFSEEAKLKMSLSHKTPEYLEYIRESKLGVNNEKLYKQVVCVETGEVFKSRKHASKKMGIGSTSKISRVIDNPLWHTGGFHWASSVESSERMKPNLARYEKRTPKKIQCYETGQLFDSLADACRFVSKGETRDTIRWASKSIRKAINNQDKTAYGYHWVTPGRALKNPRIGGGRKKWIRCVETGESFPSVADAAKSINVTVSAISQAAKKGRACKGLNWQYVD